MRGKWTLRATTDDPDFAFEIERGPASVASIYRGKDAEGDAHLIAAAPALYEALENAGNRLKVLGASAEAIAEVRAALTQARGEQP